MICIYKLIFNYTLDELNEEWDRFNEFDSDIVFNLDAESFFDYEKDEKYICYLIVELSEINKYICILRKYNIDFRQIDISQSILEGKYIDELINYINFENTLKYDFFIDDINNWMLDNLNIDIILDKISSTGISSLSDIEKQFLKKIEND